MDENSNKINAIEPLHTTSMASHPLIATIVTLYTLIFLYFPTISASPLIISTSLLLLSLLRFGVAQRISQEQTEKKKKPESQIPDFACHDDCTNFKNDSVVDPDPDPDQLQFRDDGSVDDSNVDNQDSEPIMFHADCSVESNVDSNCENDSVVDLDSDPDPLQFHDDGLVVDDSNMDSNCEKDSVFDPEPEPRPFYGDCFVEWNVRAPLEVIYEAYEGEEEEEEEGEFAEEKRKEAFGIIERYASLSMYYPETDTDTDSSSAGDSPVIGNWDSPENECSRWDDEDREELIEIELDCKRNSEVEEENLIEIDLNPAKFPAR